MRRCSPGPSTSRRRNSRSSSGTKGSDGGEGLPGDVLILAEHLEGRIAPSTLEAIAVGRELGSRSGGRSRVALFGHDVRALADVLAGTGTEVLLADDPALAEYTPDGYGQAARAVVESANPRLILVSAGRGIQKKENLALIEEFAKALGGVVGASRPLTDMDWLPKTRQVGQSGKTVRPKLYVACGISGAMQHVAGMKDASLIVAINTDPTAPIFEVAHVGFVADVLKLLPATLKELKA